MPELPEITDLLDMEFEDEELEPTILPVDARLSLRGKTEEFRDLFERLTAVTPQKEKIPGTSLVYVTAANGTVRFTATDGSVRTLILETDSISIPLEGAARLPGHKLRAIFALAPDPAITITLVGENASVTSGRAVWNVAVPTSEKIPPVPDVSDIQLHSVARRPLFKALNAVKRALPSLGGRKSLEQVNFSVGAVTASDGYRLLRRRIPGFPEELSFRAPSDAVDELIRSLTTGSEENIFLGASEDFIVLKDGGETLVARQLTLDFPDLESQLIAPALENTNSLILDTTELRDLVKRVRIFADQEYASVTLRTEKKKSGDWEMTVLTRDRAGNSASEAMYVQWEGDSEPPELVLNHKFLVDLMDAYNGRLATIQVGNSTKTRSAPIILRDDEKGFTGVVQQSVRRQ